MNSMPQRNRKMKLINNDNKKPLIKKSVYDEIASLDEDAIKRKMDLLSEQYMVIATRISKELKSAESIQAQMQTCVEELGRRGIKVEVESIEQDNKQSNG